MAAIRFERSEACAENHSWEFDPEIDIVVPYSTKDGLWIQITYDGLRTQDGDVIATVVDGDWWYEGKPYSDVIIDFEGTAASI